MNSIKVFRDTSSLYQSAADRFVTLARKSIKSHKQFTVALSGGSTPQRLYHLLTTKDYSVNLNWKQIHLFFGDERYVPKDHSESNYRMVRKTLLDSISIPEKNIHRIRCELKPEQAAENYELQLLSSLDRLDLVLLGMGTDGHTASLFPGRSMDHEKNRLVVAFYVDKLKSWRISLTPEAINSASNIMFLVTGKEKAKPLKQVLEGPYLPDILPSQSINASHGHLDWLLDTNAASLLSQRYTIR